MTVEKHGFQAEVTREAVRLHAPDLVVALAKAQPFEDGNKRTALFVANDLLRSRGFVRISPLNPAD
jgi:prophage maintenance system killer protein